MRILTMLLAPPTAPRVRLLLDTRPSDCAWKGALDYCGEERSTDCKEEVEEEEDEV